MDRKLLLLVIVKKLPDVILLGILVMAVLVFLAPLISTYRSEQWGQLYSVRVELRAFMKDLQQNHSGALKQALLSDQEKLDAIMIRVAKRHRKSFELYVTEDEWLFYDPNTGYNYHGPEPGQGEQVKDRRELLQRYPDTILNEKFRIPLI